MDKVKLLFESYDEIAEKYLEEYRVQNDKRVSKIVENNALQELENYMMEAMEYMNIRLKEWEQVELEGLGGITPKKFFESITSLEEAIEVFKIGAVASSSDTPLSLQEKLKSFGDSAVDEVIKLATDTELIKSSGDEVSIAAAAIEQLGKWGVTRAAGSLVNIVDIASEDNEIILERLRFSICKMGERAIEPIMEKLTTTDIYNNSYDYLVEALSEIGANKKNDAVYKCLKEAFGKMESKVIGAICLSKYGDGRAVTALRGYVLKNIRKIDRETFYEIKRAVEILGGSMEDMSYQE